jgi:two-component system, cell cycle sensor histidine kinase and response regulator CckA
MPESLEAETIFILDDEEMIRDLGTRILTEAGYSVITASNGQEALELYKGKSDEISLVILDIIMPEMGGKHCLEELLKIDPKAKVIVACGFSEGGSMKDVRDGGAKGFVSKPFDKSRILQVLRETPDSEQDAAQS